LASSYYRSVVNSSPVPVFAVARRIEDLPRRRYGRTRFKGCYTIDIISQWLAQCVRAHLIPSPRHCRGYSRYTKYRPGVSETSDISPRGRECIRLRILPQPNVVTDMATHYNSQDCMLYRPIVVCCNCSRIHGETCN